MSPRFWIGLAVDLAEASTAEFDGKDLLLLWPARVRTFEFGGSADSSHDGHAS